MSTNSGPLPDPSSQSGARAPSPSGSSVGPTGRGHEESDASAKWIFASVLGLAVLVLCIHFILAGWLSSLKASSPPTDAWRPVQQASQAPSGFPRLQVSPSLDLDSFRAREERELSSYGWIDKKAGAVRIPIERAMDLVLKEGLPVRSGTNQGKPGPSSAQLIQQRTEHRQPEIQREK